MDCHFLRYRLGVHIAMLGVIFLATACVVLASLFVRYRGPKRCNLPGPIGLPHFGISPFMTEAPYKYFRDLAKKYGDVFCCQLERCDIVLLNSFEVIDEFFRKKADIYQDRYCNVPETADFQIGFGEIQWGPKALELRDFSIRALSDRNVGKGSYDDMVNFEVSEYCKYIKEVYGTKAVNPFPMTRKCFSNVLMTFLCQKRYDYRKKDLEPLFHAVEGLLLSMHPDYFYKNKTEMKLRRMLNMYPVNLVDINEEAKRFTGQRARDEVAEFLAREEAGTDENYCFLARCWNAIKEKKANGEKTFLTKNSMTGVLMNLIGGGLHSTSTVGSWVVKILTKKQDIQKKLREEIFAKLGTQPPGISDKKNLDYVSAFLQECERFISLAPTGIPHTSSQDSTYKGYFIPKGTYIFSNLWAIHYDEKIFPEPYEFRPERFIDAGGNFVRSKYVNVFGIGKRSCPGQVFVQREMFLFIVQLLQTFELKPPEGVSPESLVLKGKFDGHGLLPPSYDLRFIPIASNPAEG